MINQDRPASQTQHGRDRSSNRCQSHGVPPAGAGNKYERRIGVGQMAAVSGEPIALPAQPGALKTGAEGSHGLLHLSGIHHDAPSLLGVRTVTNGPGR